MFEWGCPGGDSDPCISLTRVLPPLLSHISGVCLSLPVTMLACRRRCVRCTRSGSEFFMRFMLFAFPPLKEHSVMIKFPDIVNTFVIPRPINCVDISICLSYSDRITDRVSVDTATLHLLILILAVLWVEHQSSCCQSPQRKRGVQVYYIQLKYCSTYS